MSRLRTSDVATQAGVNIETLRFYEREGLLPEPPRSPSGYRAFTRDDVQRVRFVKRAQELGFSLREIKELLALDEDADCADVRARADAKLDDIDRKVNDLKRMRKALARLRASCPGRGDAAACPILNSLRTVSGCVAPSTRHRESFSMS